MKWRVIVSGKTNPYLNMAIDEAIYRYVAEGQSPPTLRFYDWEPSAFSYGYNQMLEKELDIERVKESPYLFVRRPTGGRLVLHDDEVTYSVISPISEEMSGSLTNAYLRIATGLQKGLELMGVQVDLSDRSLSSEHQKQIKNPCFSSSSLYELNFNGKKIVGSAQVRNNRAFLQHGAVLRTNNQSSIADFLPNTSEEEKLRVKTYLSRKTITISNILNRSVSYEETVNHLQQGFIKQWEEDDFFFASDYNEKENALADRLYHQKYTVKEWNEKTSFEKKVLTH